jgi:hypothetical protein
MVVQRKIPSGQPVGFKVVTFQGETHVKEARTLLSLNFVIGNCFGRPRIPEAMLERACCLAWFLAGLSQSHLKDFLIFEAASSRKGVTSAIIAFLNIRFHASKRSGVREERFVVSCGRRDFRADKSHDQSPHYEF